MMARSVSEKTKLPDCLAAVNAHETSVRRGAARWRRFILAVSLARRDVGRRLVAAGVDRRQLQANKPAGCGRCCTFADPLTPVQRTAGGGVYGVCMLGRLDAGIAKRTQGW